MQGKMISLLTAALLIAVVVSGSVSAQSGQRQFNISAQPLASALRQFADQSELQLAYPTADVEGLQTTGVTGAFTPEDGLSQLLRGTGLSFQFLGEKTVTLVKTATNSSPETLTQPETSGAAERTRDAFVVPEVSVVGDKLNRPMQDIPQSVTVFEGEEILRQAATTSAREVFYRTPNVSVGEPANGSFQIRGVNNNNVVRNTDTGSNGSITVFSNSIPLSFSSADYLPPSLWDVSSVEIFKGPQSATQGPNSLAGAVLFNYQEPQFNYEGRTRFTYGRFNTVNAAVAQNLPLIDEKLALRVSYERQSSDGPIENKILDRDDYAKVDRHTFRGQALLRPYKNDDLEAKLTVTSDWWNGNSTPAHGGFTPFFDRIGSSDTPERDDIYGVTTGLVIKARVNDAVQITSISGLNHLDLQQILDGTPTPDGFIDFFREEYIGTQEVRVNYTHERFRGVLGVFGQYGDYNSGFDYMIPGFGAFVKKLTDERWNIAAFGDGEYDLTNRLSVGAGLRLHHEKYAVRMAQDVFGSAIGSESIQKTDTVPLPTFHLGYQVSEPLKVGFLISRGFRSGGGSVTYSPQDSVLTGAYGPEYIWNYEIFFRSVWLDGDLMIDGNAFFVDWNDMIITIPTAGAFGTTDTITLNAGAAELYGFELQTIYTPFAGLTLPLGVGYTHTEFTDFELEPGMNVAGQAFPNAPNWSLSAGVDYQARNGLFATTTFSWRDSTYAQVQNPRDTRLQERELLSMKIGYQASHWSVYMFGSNLLDDDYATLLYQLPDAPFLTGNSGYPWTLGFGIEAYW